MRHAIYTVLRFCYGVLFVVCATIFAAAFVAAVLTLERNLLP